MGEWNRDVSVWGDCQLALVLWKARTYGTAPAMDFGRTDTIVTYSAFLVFGLVPSIGLLTTNSSVDQLFGECGGLFLRLAKSGIWIRLGASLVATCMVLGAILLGCYL